jgi:hypothetical protein
MGVYDTTDRQAVGVQTVDQDSLRALQLFQAFRNFSGDQTYNNTDSIPSGPNGAFVIANPDGTASVVGRSTSNVQGGARAGSGLDAILGNPLMLLGLGFMAWKLLK